ncbi:ParA family protein [Aphanothece hegewaldii CCALA 016]|uniref:ParA family protein n=1 Tax=Aphanothece hegewaldii CCALA 016 TaxID=2107694 RepID=A0A2T1LQX9_9CHRO|nr:AAA family ATPase [Aphanothece hegewaldii]PSF30242.1 ParA family protein [Aphanothece hegewaldii CCALA 016]
MIIALVNQKGGVAKTTSSICLGGILAETALCLVVDLDPQGNLTTGLGLNLDDSEDDQPTIYEVLKEEATVEEAIVRTKLTQLDLLPADIYLANGEPELIGKVGSSYILSERLAPVKDKYAHILIDCPPSLGILTVNALTCADAVLIPVQCQFFALKGLASLLDTIQAVQKRLNPNLKILGVIPTMADNTVMCRDVLDSLAKRMQDLTTIFEPVPKSVKFAESNLAGEPIHLYAAKDPKLSEPYRAIAQKILSTN